MTKREMRRAAKEARRLAYECADGAAPPMVNFTRDDGRGGHCALGWIEAWARCRIYLEGCAHEIMVARASNFDDPIGADAFMTPGATDHAARQARLVFPLLSLADALDSAALASSASAAQPPPKEP